MQNIGSDLAGIHKKHGVDRIPERNAVFQRGNEKIPVVKSTSAVATDRIVQPQGT